MGEQIKNTLEQQTAIYRRVAPECADAVLQRYVESQGIQKHADKLKAACAEKIKELIDHAVVEEAAFAVNNGFSYSPTEARQMLDSGDFGSKVKKIASDHVTEHFEEFGE